MIARGEWFRALRGRGGWVSGAAGPAAAEAGIHRDRVLRFSQAATNGQIALTVTEARRLFQLFTHLLRDLPTAPTTRRMAFHPQWSTWRRRHQARARWHHYKQRLTDLD